MNVENFILYQLNNAINRQDFKSHYQQIIHFSILMIMTVITAVVIYDLYLKMRMNR